MPDLSNAPVHRRQLLLGSASLLLTGCVPPSALSSPHDRSLPPGASALTLLGEITLAHKLLFRETAVGGLSAIDYDPATGLFDLLSDDRSDLAPARLYRAKMTLTPAGLLPPELVEVVTLKQANGQPWPGKAHAAPGVAIPDPEAMRRLPDGKILWSSEGDFARGFPVALYASGADGTLLRQFALPACFSVGRGHGARDNRGFEGLTINPPGTQAWVAMESALQQDGAEPSTTSAGGHCRFTQFDIRTGAAVRQIAYALDAIPVAPVIPGTFADNGVSEVLLQDDHQLLVLERSYALGRGTSLRLYRIDTRDGSNTLALDALTATNHSPARKTLVADFKHLGLSRLDNTEGMTWGPRLPDGRRTLWFVSDDNFNPMQVTQIAVFGFDA